MRGRTVSCKCGDVLDTILPEQRTITPLGFFSVSSLNSGAGAADSDVMGNLLPTGTKREHSAQYTAILENGTASISIPSSGQSRTCPVLCRLRPHRSFFVPRQSSPRLRFRLCILMSDRTSNPCGVEF